MILTLALTMESGQPPHFLWNHAGERFHRRLDGKDCYIWNEKTLKYTPTFGSYVTDMLRLDDNYNNIYKKIATDKVMQQAIKKYQGLRITKNDPWESLVCFICSINTSIPQIKRNVQSLMHNGKLLTPEQMTEKNTCNLKLGFRRQFLCDTAEIIKNEPRLLEKIGKMPYADAKERLMELRGVADKVSECVLLFGYGHMQAFPIDVWVRRGMQRYFIKKKLSDRKVREYAQEKWGNCAGYANHYVFYWTREAGR